MGGETQTGSLVAHELNAMGYTQLALESQAKASLVQGCANAPRLEIHRRERAPHHTLHTPHRSIHAIQHHDTPEHAAPTHTTHYTTRCTP